MTLSSLSPESGPPAVSFESVSRLYGSVRAVDDVDLSVAPGEFFAMLGPSGSGKTTCLRLVAGFERPSSGHVRLFGEKVEDLPPYRRDVNTVFQDYALFPHLNILENVSFGLKMKGVDAPTRQRAAEEALELVKLPGYGGRKPGQLSGGQRQRVALARALVNKPKVLLLDEPLGALDLKLREQMQEELKTIQRSLGVTFIFVTHDQGEALSMADRVAVFSEGKIRQIGTPQEIYNRPRTRFVADFVGSSNVLPPEFVERHTGARRWGSLRPEQIALQPPTGRGGGEAARVAALNYLGAATRVGLDLAQGPRIHAAVPAALAAGLSLGQSVEAVFAPDAIHLMEDAP